MLANLLNNAFKYSDRDSCVLLGIKAQEHAIQLSEVMKGTGISDVAQVARNQAAGLALAWCAPSPWRMVQLSM